MSTSVTIRGFEPTPEVQESAEALAGALSEEAAAEMVKLVLERTGERCSAGVVVATRQEVIVRHATAMDWEGALRELELVTREELASREDS